MEDCGEAKGRWGCTRRMESGSSVFEGRCILQRTGEREEMCHAGEAAGLVGSLAWMVEVAGRVARCTLGLQASSRRLPEDGRVDIHLR
jgi:hypothetical protein